MLKKIHLFILRSFLWPLIIAFAIAMFVLLMQFLWKYVDDMAGKGLDYSIIAELMLYAAASLVPLALPIAVLFASLMTFGNLGENLELMAIKSAGISLWKAMMPAAILVVFITIGAFVFADKVQPVGNLKLGSLLYDITRKRPEMNITPGSFNSDIDGYTIKISGKNYNTNMLYNFILYDHKDNKGNRSVTIADSAKMQITQDKKHLIVNMFHGFSHDEVKEDRKKIAKVYPHRRSSFAEQRLIFELDESWIRTNSDLFKDNYLMLNMGTLNYAIDSLGHVYDRRRQHFANNILKSNIFKREQKADSSDSLLRLRSLLAVQDSLPVIENIDSLFAGLIDAKRERVSQIALNYSRATKSYVSSSERDLNGRKRWINNHRIEWHKKLTFSLACFVFFLIGAPLGAIIRKGGLGVPVVASVLIFITFYMVSLLGDKFVREGLLPAWEGMWMAIAITLPLGIYLSYKAANDAVIVTIESYSEYFKGFFKKGNQPNNKIDD